jgi:hypothetical protein
MGTIAAGGPLGEGFLHFAIAYGATWDSFLQHRAILPSDVSADWIQRRYIDPETYLISPQTGDESGS